MVEILKSTFVVPSEQTPERKHRLSNLDQVAPNLYSCFVFHYRYYEARDFFSTEVLKAALARTLVLFYPLAGRVLIEEGSIKAVDCNDEGALFVVAQSERCSDDINFEPSPELRRMFVPSAPSTTVMLMLQVESHLNTSKLIDPRLGSSFISEGMRDLINLTSREET